MTACCPICRKPTDSQTNPDFPFCSERCRLLDLGNWASEKYKISSPVFDESELEDEGRDADQSRRERGDRENNGNDARGHHR
jgi:uncharacterized protein